MEEHLTAGLISRVSAFISDMILIFMPIYILFKIFMHGSTEFHFIIFLIDIKTTATFYVSIIYIITTSLLIYNFNGATIGKKIIYMKIVNSINECELSVKQIAIRQLFFILYIYAPLLILLSVGLIFFRKDGRSIHDIISSSKVVFIKNNI